MHPSEQSGSPPDESSCDHPDWAAVQALGGPAAVARLCEITSQAVSQWRTKGMPKAQRRYLKLLRPDAFDGVPDPGPASQAGELDEAEA